MAIQTNWKLAPVVEPPDEFVAELKNCTSHSCRYLAPLLWQRGIRDRSQLPGFLNPNRYQPSSPFEFGAEMQWAMERLQQARERGETIAIWGDFDADGITATAVLWDGLGEFFDRPQRLRYTIPNRLTESHGLNVPGIDRLAKEGVNLIVTCDTGSTNLAEIEYAQQQGIDIIITDHHTLLDDRPSVAAIVNPRSLPPEHPLYHLSGVAVAYKLVEALYQTLPDVPQQPIGNLLDLVAIGLIADLVELKGDCRYLAQVGIQRLQQQLKNPTRPGVAKLLELCKKTGDRPTDISFGIGPRINAVSRIQGDASFCVELLTSRDPQRCNQLALETELANTRRQSLQRDVARLVQHKLAQIDLSTTSVIVLEDPQWQVGVLGLVASQIAREYGRPTILLSTADPEFDSETEISQLQTSQSKMARGSARSVEGIDLYQLVKSQSHLLHRFGGHPLAAGLSLPVENLPLLMEGMNRQLGQQIEAENLQLGQVIFADLRVTVSELGQDLFQELKLIEPCGMGNPAPKFLIENCWFDQVWNRNLKDSKGRTVKYIKTEFQLWDDSATKGFFGVWWGHYKDEIPPDRCNAIVELDFNAYHSRYEARLIALYPHRVAEDLNTPEPSQWEILDWRCENISTDNHSLDRSSMELPILEQCPSSWEELRQWVNHTGNQNSIALGYPPPEAIPPEQIWQQLIGIAKYLSRTGKSVTRTQMGEKLGIGDRALSWGIQALQQLGFETIEVENCLRFSSKNRNEKTQIQADDLQAISQFLDAIREEQFRRQYFSQVSISIVRSMANPF